MNNTLPFFSIILPTYNVEKYIERCIKSCANQSFSEFELIIVDDQGNDRSIEIASNLSLSDNRIKIITNNKNLGTFAARNEGILEASGQYIIFLDPDDELTPTALDCLHRKILESEPDIVLFGRINIPTPKLQFLMPKLRNRHTPINSPLNNIFIDTPKSYWGAAGKVYSSTVAKKACLSCGLVEERLTFGEDMLFFFVAAMHAKNYISTADKLYVYYTNPESITATKKHEDLLKLKSQIDLIIFYINKIIDNQTNNLRKNPKLIKTIDIIYRALNSDKELLFRFENDPNTGRSLYLRSTINSFNVSKKPKDLFRIFSYLLTFSSIRL